MPGKALDLSWNPLDLIPVPSFNPVDAIAEPLMRGAAELGDLAFGSFLTAGQADYSQDWFITTYQRSFGVAIVIWVLLLAFNLYLGAKRSISGSEVFKNFTERSAGFYLGVMFGPIIGKEISGALSTLGRNVLMSGVADTYLGINANATNASEAAAADSAVDAVMIRLAAIDPLSMAGGGIVVLLVGIVLLLCFIGLYVLMIVVAFLQYLMGALFPVIWVAITSARHRHMAKKGLQIAFVLMLVPLLASAVVALVLTMLGNVEFSSGREQLIVGAVNGELPTAKENLDFALVTMVGIFMAVAAPIGLLMMAWRSTTGVMDSMKEGGKAASAVMGKGGTTAAAASNASNAGKGAAALGIGTAATVATAGAAAPVAAAGGAGAGASTGMASGAATSAATGAGSKVAATGSMPSGVSGGTSKARRVTDSVAKVTEEAANRAKMGRMQHMQSTQMAMHLSDSNDAEGGDTR